MEVNYVITIKNDTAEKSDSPTAQTSKTQKKEDGFDIKKGVLAGIAGVKVAENYADKIVSYNLNTISLRTGQVHYQQKVQFIKDTSKKVIDTLIYSVLAGAITGNVGVAVMGISSGLLSGMIDLAQKERTLNIKRENENMTIRANNIRAGASGNRPSALRE